LAGFFVSAGFVCVLLRLLAFEGAALGQVVKVVIDACGFPLKKSFHRIGKRRVGQPVGAVGGDWHEGAGHFVFALGAAFKALHAVGNAPAQRLVVASLKV
jgi:hypothetical protein